MTDRLKIFEIVHNRKHTHSYKWDQGAILFGSDEVLPMWVADMDFESPPAVKDAIIRRAEQGIYGYTIKPDGYNEAILDWFQTRHGWKIENDWLVHSPGVVTSLSLAVELFSEPGQPVILQSPVYYPFYDVIRLNGRVVAENPLIERHGRYEMDFDHLEQLMKDGARLMLLCSPHNPGGRVWTRDELTRLAELAVKYDVVVISDEIHCDLVLKGHRHVPLATISEEMAQRTITCLAPTKTFNLPGLPISFIVTANPAFRRKLLMRIKALSLHMTGFFNPDALMAAYREGSEWLDSLLDYLQQNLDYTLQFLRERLPQIKPMVPEATYLLWMDCRPLGLDAAGLKELMYKKAKVAFNEGSSYGKPGEGFLRLNFACPRTTLQEGLERFARALEA